MDDNRKFDRDDKDLRPSNVRDPVIPKNEKPQEVKKGRGRPKGLFKRKPCKATRRSERNKGLNVSFNI